MKLPLSAIALTALLTVPALITPANACTVPLICESTVTTAGGVLLVCPAGDGPTLASIGATVSVTILYCSPPVPLASLPPQDIWIQSLPVSDPRFCNGHGYQASAADGPTDASGQTTISGSVAACGYFDDPLYVFAGGVLLNSQDGCDQPLPLIMVSPDINADHIVDIVDLSMFGPVFSGGGTDPRMDYNGDAQVDIVDFSLFGAHFLHACGQ